MARGDKLNPTIIIDKREQNPLAITAYRVERGTLRVGDYAIKRNELAFVVERKSLEDLVGSLTAGHDRFYHEIEKMHGLGRAILLIEAWPQDVQEQRYHSSTPARAVFGMLNAITVRTPIKIHWAGSHEGAAREFEWLVRLFCEGVQKQYKTMFAPATTKTEAKGEADEMPAPPEP